MAKMFVNLCSWVTDLDMNSDNKLVLRFVKMFDWVTFRLEKLSDRLKN